MDNSKSIYIFKTIIKNQNLTVRVNKDLEDLLFFRTGGEYGENFIRESLKSCLIHPDLEKFKFSPNTAQNVFDFEYALMVIFNDFLSAKPILEKQIYDCIELISSGRYGGSNEI